MNKPADIKGLSWWLVVFPLVIVALGTAAQNLTLFDDLRSFVGGRVIPDVLSKSGRTGKEFRLLEYQPLRGIQWQSFERELGPDEMPSTRILADQIRPLDVPAISVAMDPDDLLDRQAGIVANPLRRGRGWERPAYVSYFSGRELKFATGAGVRVHGGISRQMSPKSMRLHFRELYGLPWIGSGAVFAGDDVPMRSLIIHNDVRATAPDAEWHFTNPIAYELSRRIGCLTPRTLPVRFYLNGAYLGPFVLTEHLSADNIRARLGHDDFVLVYGKADKEKGASPVAAGDPRHFATLQAWAADRSRALTMPEAARRVELDNLTNWWISVAYAAVTDKFQGRAILDLSKADARWYWINWDMDKAFMDMGRRVNHPWELDVFAGEYAADPRSVIFNRLRRESPAYRQYFLNRLVTVLNHRLTPDFVQRRVNDYELLAQSLDIQNRSFFESLREFLKHRPAALRAQMDTYFAAGPSHELTLQTNDLEGIRVDGYPVAEPYQGHYFAATPVEISVDGPARAKFAGWRVNGEHITPQQTRLALRLAADTHIEVLRHGSLSMPPDAAAAAIQAHRPEQTEEQHNAPGPGPAATAADTRHRGHLDGALDLTHVAGAIRD